MADLSTLSDEQLKAIADGKMDTLPDDVLAKIAGDTSVPQGSTGNAPVPQAAQPAPIPRPDTTTGPTAGMDPFARTGYVMSTPQGKQAMSNAVTLGKNLGLEGGGATAGQILGAPFEEFGGVHIGGSIGAGIGNTLAQLTTPGKKFSFGDVGAAMAAGTVPGLSLEKAGAKELLTQGAKYALSNAAGTYIQKGADQKRLPTLGEVAQSEATGFAAAPISKFLDSGSRALATANRAGNASVERQSLNGGRELDLLVPPAVTAPNAINNTIQSVGGKAAVAQETLLRNQPKVDSIVRRVLGIPEGTGISVPVLNAQKVGPNLVYDEVSKMTPASAALLDAYKTANTAANTQHGMFQSAKAQGIYRPDLKEAANVARTQAATFRAALDKEAATIPGGKDIIGRFDDAEVKLAQIALADQALRKGNGKIDATAFGDAFEANPERLSGDFKKLGAFQSAFGKYVKDATNTPPSGVDWLKTTTKAGFGAAGAGKGYLMGGPAGAAIGAVVGAGVPMAAEKGARELALSPFYQNNFAKPFYGATTEDFPAGVARIGTMGVGRDLPSVDTPLTEEEQKRLQELRALVGAGGSQ